MKMIYSCPDCGEDLEGDIGEALWCPNEEKEINDRWLED